MRPSTQALARQLQGPNSSSDMLNILLIEDDEVDVMAVRRVFRAHKIECPLFVAIDGVEALARLRAGEIPKPFIVLVDLNMPRMGGIEFLQELRADPELKDSVVFVVTTSEAEEDRAAAQAEQIAGYIVKSSVANDFSQLTALLDAYGKLVT